MYPQRSTWDCRANSQAVGMLLYCPRDSVWLKTSEASHRRGMRCRRETREGGVTEGATSWMMDLVFALVMGETLVAWRQNPGHLDAFPCPVSAKPLRLEMSGEQTLPRGYQHFLFPCEVRTFYKCHMSTYCGETEAEQGGETEAEQVRASARARTPGSQPCDLTSLPQNGRQPARY